MYNNITVIGVGTLGGYIALNLLENNFCKKMTIIDPDVVEAKNLENSLYKITQIGDYKVDAIEEIFIAKGIYDVNIEKNYEKFIDGQFRFDNSTDLVLDCRDRNVNRDPRIDCRLHISSRYFFVDCRKNVLYNEEVEAKYLSAMSSLDLQNASIIFCNLIQKKILDLLIKKQMLQSYDLDYYRNISNNTECNILYESSNGEEKFINLKENLLPIIEQNRQKPISVFIGSKSDPIASCTYPKQSLQDSKAIINHFNMLTQINCNYNYYLIVLKDDTIELIPEVGAA